jgi:L,D-transpeptidase ErfK/SrfK
MFCFRQKVSLRLFILVTALGLLCAGRSSLAATYAIEGDTAGEVKHYVAQEDDNLFAVARRFDLGIAEVLAANPGVDRWLPKEGTKLALPTMHILPPVERKGIVINLAELRLYYFPDQETVMTYPLGIGQDGWETPVGHTIVAGKRKDPTWIPPPSIRRENPDLPAVFPPGPDNPLGAFALDLGWSEYRIHGTNHPYGIGWRSSHGCMRLYPEDIAKLFPEVAIGTPVTVVDAPYKLGWKDNELWLEVTPTQQQVDDIVEHRQPAAADIPGIHKIVVETAGDAANIDWYAVGKAFSHPTGIPVVIAERDVP